MAITSSIKDNKLTLVIDLDKVGKDSATGKMVMHASSGGFKDVSGSDFKYNVMVGTRKQFDGQSN